MCQCCDGGEQNVSGAGTRRCSGGLFAIAALLALQSQDLVTSQGQRFCGFPPERVNDRPLPGLTGAWWGGTELKYAAASSSHGRVKGKALGKIQDDGFSRQCG